MTLLPRILTALALIGLLTMAAPPTWTEVQAQSKAAKNLKCKGCVGSKDLGKKAVKMKNLDKKLQNKIQENMMGANRHAFHAEMSANETRTLLTLGPFVIFAKCILNAGGLRGVEVFLRSTVNNWLHPNFSGSLLPSSFELLLFEFFVTVATINAYRTFLADGGLSPAGVFLGLIFGGIAINYQGIPCKVTGFADGYESG